MALWRVVYIPNRHAVEYDKHNSRDSNQLLLNDNNQQVLEVPGAKSPVYDWLVCLLTVCVQKFVV